MPLFPTAHLTLIACVLAGLLYTSSAQASEEVQIRRDAWGVPHIVGPTDASVVFGFLYAQAEDNFWQVEDTIIQALGRQAEVVGERALGSDYINRALRVGELARTEHDGLPSEHKRLLAAAAAGLNQWLADSGHAPRLITRFEPWHFLAASRFSQYQLFVFNGCKTYTSYPDAMYAHANKDSSNLDIISTVNFSWLSEMTTVRMSPLR